jgi:hypothetical protein
MHGSPVRQDSVALVNLAKPGRHGDEKKGQQELLAHILRGSEACACFSDTAGQLM